LAVGSSGLQRDELVKYMKENPFDYFVFDTTGNQKTLPDIMVHDGQISQEKIRYFDFTESLKSEGFSLLEDRLKNTKVRFINPIGQMKFEFTTIVKYYNRMGMMKVHAPETKGGKSKAGYHDDVPCSVMMANYIVDTEVSKNHRAGGHRFNIA